MVAKYSQFILFGDSITEQSTSQERGFGFAAALQAGMISEITTVFFGANDAIAKEANNGQYVPLDDFKKNLRQLLQHEVVKAHNPRLILITPPPVDEYQLEIADKAKGYDTSLQRRTAERTKSYADAAYEVGRELGVTVLDIWTAFMLKAGWKQGKPLLGSSKLPRSPVLSELLYDGMFALISIDNSSGQTYGGQDFILRLRAIACSLRR
ncbi:hypothetical protein H2199_006556 [Coniosporium tulheliwenetii]|uniref:Uncharacterized protein n=1 Tax=Coniosporium tulheliwenetii TaxID=3383036 RepID=A0ACC2YWP7_9PEZI|nr:hypothetical protein H2199_006556 [Cladosporium sp. JES 115]